MNSPELSLLVQILCLIATALYSVIYHEKIRRCLVFGVLAMLFAIIFGQIILAGGGPGAFVGFVILPLYGVVVSLISVYTTRFVKKLIKKVDSASGTTNIYYYNDNCQVLI